MSKKALSLRAYKAHLTRTVVAIEATAPRSTERRELRAREADLKAKVAKLEPRA